MDRLDPNRTKKYHIVRKKRCVYMAFASIQTVCADKTIEVLD